MYRNRKGFTLIELITVMAISAILLSIITVPMIQTFAATRQAQSYSDAQDAARLLTERVAKEISEAAGVREVEGLGGRVAIVIQPPARGVDQNGVAVTVPNAGTSFITVGMNYTKLDLIMPQKVGQRGPGGGFIDPNTGKEDPTLNSEKGQVLLPLAPGRVLKRYWIGLRDPFQNYRNPYDGLLTVGNGTRDNLFVLYSAEVEPMRLVETPVGSGNFVSQVNTDFFDVDPRDPSGQTPLYDDPAFFLATNANIGTPINNDAKAARIQNWIRRSKILSEVSRYDMIQPVIEKGTQRVRLNPTVTAPGWAPQITPLVQFRPSFVEGGGTEAMMTASLGDETDGVDIGSEVYQSQFGLWSNVFVRFFDSNWAPGQDYLVGRKSTNDPRLDTPSTFDHADDFALFRVNPAVTGESDTLEGSGNPLFNVSMYDRLRKSKFLNDPQARYPFSSSIIGTITGDDLLAFAPFATNNTTGKIMTGFAIGDVGNPTLDPNTGNFNAADLNLNNLPQVPAQSDSAWVAGEASLTPTTDPSVATGTFSDAPFFSTATNRFSINRVFNKVFEDGRNGRNGIPAQFGEVGGAHRFIDLRTIPQGDGTPSPLAEFDRARIVPGSEEVFGPDQNPGLNFGHEVRYRRVNKEPGPNEYRINYVNLPEPTPAGWVALGLTPPPPSYVRTNFVSAIVQPRFRAGYIQLCSNPEVPIPATMQVRSQNPALPAGTFVSVPGRIRVSYRFQFTGANDVLRVEYDTRQLMQVIATIRNYPQSSTPNPQTVTMKATANVKNFIR